MGREKPNIEKIKVQIYIHIYFWLYHAAFTISVSQKRIETEPLAVEVQSPNHWLDWQGIPKIYVCFNVCTLSLQCIEVLTLISLSIWNTFSSFPGIVLFLKLFVFSKVCIDMIWLYPSVFVTMRTLGFIQGAITSFSIGGGNEGIEVYIELNCKIQYYIAHSRCARWLSRDRVFALA